MCEVSFAIVLPLLDKDNTVCHSRLRRSLAGMKGWVVRRNAWYLGSGAMGDWAKVQ